jgi:hypothetical protein
MKTEKTILDEQAEIQTALDHLPALAAQLPAALKPLVKLSPRKGLRVQVSLRRGNVKDSRQVKQNAPARSWLPDSGLVAIFYRPSTPEEDQALDATVEDVQDSLGKPAETATKPAEAANDPVQDMVVALARAEKDPQLGFVSLKWFRDTYLPQQGFPWAAMPDERQRVLVNAIDRNWILTSKVANPKNPQFPVTAIKVNRPLADVRNILNQETGPSRSPFNPVAMRGEPLSQTVLRERR